MSSLTNDYFCCTKYNKARRKLKINEAFKKALQDDKEEAKNMIRLIKKI